MKRWIALVLLLSAPSLFAERPNPADYTITVHVVGSANTSGVGGIQRLAVVIDGRPLELEGFSQGILALGDYKAKLTAVRSMPKHHAAYDTFTAYELLLPDGKVREYDVVAIGTAPVGACDAPPAASNP